VSRRAAVARAWLALSLTACGHGGSPAPSVGASGPSGALGVFTQADADDTIAGLCRLTTLPLTSVDAANGTFYDQVHEHLHVLAAATDPVDRRVSGALLEAKERVEEDLLAGGSLPSSYPDDARTLLAATRTALSTVGLRAAAC